MLVGIHLDVWDELVIAIKVTRCPCSQGWCLVVDCLFVYNIEEKDPPPPHTHPKQRNNTPTSQTIMCLTCRCVVALFRLIMCLTCRCVVALFRVWGIFLLFPI